MAMMTTPSAAAAQLGAALPAILWTTHLVAGCALTLQREAEKRNRLLRRRKLCEACGRKWGNIVRAAKISHVLTLASPVLGHRSNEFIRRLSATHVGYIPIRQVDFFWPLLNERLKGEE